MGEVLKIDESVSDVVLDSTPHSGEAEQALLGAILYDNEVYNRVSGIVKAEHFYNPVHVRIYDAIRGLCEAGKLADAIVLKNRFERDDLLEDIGGVEYLALLLDAAPTSATAPEYAKLVTDYAVRRDLIRLASEVDGQAKDKNSERQAAEQIQDAEEALYTLAEHQTVKRGFSTFSESLVSSIDNISAAYARDGGLSGISTGLRDLDQLLGGLHKSDLIILAGRPSMGKSALAMNIAFHMAKSYRAEKNEDGVYITKDGGRVGFYSLEMSKEQLATRLLAQDANIPSNVLRRGDITLDQYNSVRDSAERLDRIPLHIDDMGGQTVGAIATKARRLKRTHGLDCLVIDYLQLLSAGKKVNGQTNRTTEVTIISQELKALAKELDVPVLALAQLSRQVELRENKRPQLSDLRESGSIEQDADVVAFVYREEYYLERDKPKDELCEDYHKWAESMERAAGKGEVIVAKQRHGPIGDVALRFTGWKTEFSDLEASQ